MKTFLRRQFFKYCPSSLLQVSIRNLIQLDYTDDPDLVVKIAETQEELEGAFKVLYRSYLEMGYCERSESEMRLTLHHALPTSSVIIAKYKHEVVGTMTLVRGNNLGLPCEKEWSIDNLKRHDRRVAEITSLAIDKRFRRIEKGNILFPILKYMYEFSTDYFGTQILAIVIHPKERDFYEGLFFFESISDKVVEDYYGAPAIALYLDLEEARRRYVKVYGSRKAEKNLSHYFTRFKSPCLVMPRRNSFSVDYPVMDKTLFEYFFFEKSSLGEAMTGDVLNRILQHFPGSDRERPASRFSIDAPARINEAGSERTFDVVIKNISLSGLRLVIASDRIENLFEEGKSYELRFQHDDFVTIQICNRWNQDQRQAGFIVAPDQLNWFHFLKVIQNNYLHSDEIKEVIELHRSEAVA